MSSNAQRLLDDAKALHERGSSRTALALAILAIEEFVKAHTENARQKIHGAKIELARQHIGRQAVDLLIDDFLQFCSTRYDLEVVEVVKLSDAQRDFVSSPHYQAYMQNVRNDHLNSIHPDLQRRLVVASHLVRLDLNRAKKAALYADDADFEAVVSDTANTELVIEAAAMLNELLSASN